MKHKKHKHVMVVRGPAYKAMLEGMKKAETSPESEELRLAARSAMIDAMAHLANDPLKAPPAQRIEPMKLAIEYFMREERNLISALQAVRAGQKDIVNMSRVTDEELARLASAEKE